MKASSSKKIGLLAWNEFQARFYLEILALGSHFHLIINRRRHNRSEVEKMQRLVPIAQQQLIDSSALLALDGEYDVLVFQTPFPGIHLFKKSRLVSLQYGLAKEPHNYGDWRAFGDLALCMGPYSVDRIAPFCPAISVGNLSLDTYVAQKDFLRNSCIERLPSFVEGRKTVLYAPTWGDLSSVDIFAEAIADLQSFYNVIVKLHHNTYLLEKRRLQNIVKFLPVASNTQTCELHALIDLADLVVSDYSGAIFDALLHNKPIVLLDIPEPLASAKLDKNSLEWRHRNEFGSNVATPAALHGVVDDLLNSPNDCNKSAKEWRKRLFDFGEKSSERAAAAMLSVATGFFQPDAIKIEKRQQLRERYRRKNSIMARVINKFFKR